MQGLVSGTAPYLLWFFFTADADLLCDGCTIEHDCAGGNASYFLQDVGLVRPCSTPLTTVHTYIL